MHKRVQRPLPRSAKSDVDRNWVRDPYILLAPAYPTPRARGSQGLQEIKQVLYQTDGFDERLVRRTELFPVSHYIPSQLENAHASLKIRRKVWEQISNH